MLSSLKHFKIVTSNGPKLFFNRKVSHYLKEKVAPIPAYKPHPRKNEFIMDYRTDRQVLEDGFSPKNADFKLRFELMDQNDYEFMTQLATEHMIKEGNIFKHLNIKGEELIEMFAPMVEKWLQCQNSVILKDGDKVIGAMFGNLHTRDEFDQLYRGQLFHEKPEFIIKSDYAEDIRNAPFKSKNLNRIAVLLEELEWQTGKFLSKDIEKLGIHELYTIHPKYMRYHLATKSLLVIRSIMKKQGVTHEVGYCVATGTWKMAKNTGCETAFSLPYDRYLENGKPIFTNMYDGATAANVTMVDYKRDYPNPKKS